MPGDHKGGRRSPLSVLGCLIRHYIRGHEEEQGTDQLGLFWATADEAPLSGWGGSRSVLRIFRWLPIMPRRISASFRLIRKSPMLQQFKGLSEKSRVPFRRVDISAAQPPAEPRQRISNLHRCCLVSPFDEERTVA